MHVATEEKIRITAYVDKKFYVQAKIEAVKRGITLSELVELALRKELK